jgi:hypothetical protein
MANLNKRISLSDFATTKSETSVGSGSWLDWIVRWNGNKDAGIQQEDNNTGSMVRHLPTCKRKILEKK